MRTGALLACAASAALAGCASPATEESPVHPTIVSLNPCADAILTQVADPAQILAISHFSRDPRSSSMDPATARRFRVTGGTVEEVLALRPDVVVAGTFLPPATRSAFERLNIRVESFAIEHSVADSLTQVRKMASLSGHAARGDAMVASIEQALAKAAPPEGARPISAVVWQAEGIVPGRDALVSDLLARTGFASHSASRGLRQADFLPLEAMLADPPELILTAGTPGDGESRMLSHPALAALKDTKRAAYDPSLLYCGGPTIIRAARRLVEVRRSLGGAGDRR